MLNGDDVVGAVGNAADEVEFNEYGGVGVGVELNESGVLSPPVKEMGDVVLGLVGNGIDELELAEYGGVKLGVEITGVDVGVEVKESGVLNPLVDDMLEDELLNGSTVIDVDTVDSEDGDGVGVIVGKE